MRFDNIYNKLEIIEEMNKTVKMHPGRKIEMLRFMKMPISARVKKCQGDLMSVGLQRCTNPELSADCAYFKAWVYPVFKNGNTDHFTVGFATSDSNKADSIYGMNFVTSEEYCEADIDASEMNEMTIVVFVKHFLSTYDSIWTRATIEDEPFDDVLYKFMATSISNYCKNDLIECVG